MPIQEVECPECPNVLLVDCGQGSYIKPFLDPSDNERQYSPIFCFQHACVPHKNKVPLFYVHHGSSRIISKSLAPEDEKFLKKMRERELAARRARKQ